MSSSKEHKDLHTEFLKYISEDKVKHAYKILTGPVNYKFHSYPAFKGEVRDYRYYSDDKQQPFAFIINKKSLLFYLRLPAVTSGKYQFHALSERFKGLNKNPKGEWTIRIENIDDAEKVISCVLNKW